MAVKILVVRQVVSGGLNTVCALIAAIRREARGQPGYILGETLDPLPQSREILVISTWRSIADWMTIPSGCGCKSKWTDI